AVPGSTTARRRAVANDWQSSWTSGDVPVRRSVPRLGRKHMPENEFASLKERLLRGGIAPRQVERLLLELKTHAAAVLEEEIARGQALDVAQTVARSRLGGDDEIVRKAMEQPALKSWGARWPVIVCALVPPIGLLALAVGTISALVAGLAVGQHLGHASWEH